MPQHTMNNRLLRQYYRLLQNCGTNPKRLSLTEVSELLYCSPRYARTLIRQMQEVGLVSWQAGGGRGSKGRLQCKHNANTLRMEEAFSPSSLTDIHSEPPSVEVTGSHLRVMFDRALPSVAPTLHASRTEKWLVSNVHAGLVSFQPGRHDVFPDLAHHWSVSQDGLLWRFYLRSGLCWHNDEPVNIQQLLDVLRLRLVHPIFQHIIDSEISVDGVLSLMLSRPDAYLGHRLANPACFLAHPENPEIGLGPFRISDHTDDQLALSRFEKYYGEHPIIDTLTLVQTRKHTAPWPDIPFTLMTEPVAEKSYRDSPPSGFTYLVFNQQKGGISTQARRFILELIILSVEALREENKIHPVFSDWLPAEFRHPTEPVPLPAQLSILCVLNPLTEQVLTGLSKRMSYYGCKLNLNPINAAHWYLAENMSRYDMALGDLFFSENSDFSLDEQYRYSILLQVFLGETAWKRGVTYLDKAEKQGPRFPHCLKRGFGLLCRHVLIVPLYRYQFRVVASPSVKGIKMTATGWPVLKLLWKEPE